jgi:inner membrane transporter RhtA
VRAARGAPPELYFVISAGFHYLGPSFAVLLFAQVEVVGVAWLVIGGVGVHRPLRHSSSQSRAPA